MADVDRNAAQRAAVTRGHAVFASAIFASVDELENQVFDVISLFDVLDRLTEPVGQQRYPLSNHLRWLRHGAPGGHEAWGFLDSPALERAYEARLAALDQTDTLTAFARR
ncbi:MAG TPA: hypothetical protein PKZ97_03985 [Azospirillaceae bacterium]|nr:hypothetical protein [Azospirillaceae bacterium]